MQKMSRLSIMEKGGCQVLVQLLCICLLLHFIILLEMHQITVSVLSLFTSPFRENFESESAFQYLVCDIHLSAEKVRPVIFRAKSINES